MQLGRKNFEIIWNLSRYNSQSCIGNPGDRRGMKLHLQGFMLRFCNSEKYRGPAPKDVSLARCQDPIMILQQSTGDLPLCEDTFKKAFRRGIKGAPIVQDQR